MNTSLKIALSKGRILDETLPLLDKLNIKPTEDPATSRKLILDTNTDGMQIIIVRAADVPTYVEKGGADIGIAGKDILMEYESDNLYEPLDLKIARCNLVLAGKKDNPPVTGRLKIATKYVKTTREYFAKQAKQVEIIRLYGSMELAPVLGLADQIVDLVDTGNTLKANGLVPIETIAPISSRLIVNKAAMKMKKEIITPFIEQLAKITG